MAVRDKGDVGTGIEPSAAVAALFNDHYSRLVGLGVVITGEREQAEDLAQEAFARLLRSWERLRDEAAAVSYLKTTLVNLARSALRRRIVRIRKTPALSSEEGVGPDPSDRVPVIHALRALPYRQRVCVALRYYEGMSVEDVARVMETSIGTVKSQTHNALRHMERLLEE